MTYIQDRYNKQQSLQQPNAYDTLRPGPIIALSLGRLVIYNWHALSTSEVLAVAMSCIA